MTKHPIRITPAKARRAQAAEARSALADKLAAEEKAAVAAHEKAAKEAEDAAKEQEKTAKTTLDDAKKLLDGSATTNRNLLIAAYILFVTGLMLCLGINDEQLLLNKAPVPLPFLNLTLPIWAFASVVPLLILVVHFDLLHNLNEHSRKLQAWVRAWEAAPARAQEDARSDTSADAGSNHSSNARAGALSDQLFPFVYDFAWLHAVGKGQLNINAKLLPGLSWALYCWSPFTMLIIFFIRFADLQNYWFTGWHFVLILLDAAWLHWYWPRFPRKAAEQGQRFKRLRNVRKLPLCLMPLSILAGCWTLWLFAEIQLFLDFGGAPDRVEWAIKQEDKLSAYSSITLVPRITVPHFEVQLAPNHFTIAKLMHPGKSDAELWPETAPTIELVGRRLGFADLREAKLPRANLRGAKLGHANLVATKLSNAVLAQAQLQRAILYKTQLQGTDLTYADLRGTTISHAQLQGANIANTRLQGAEIWETQLQGADLSDANLAGAQLIQVQLQGSFLENANLLGAFLDYNAIDGSTFSNTLLLGTHLRPINQFTETSGTPKVQNHGLKLKDQGWAKELESDTFFWARLESADRRIKNAKPVQLPIQDENLFAIAWLRTVCTQVDVAKGMLQHDSLGRKLPVAITDSALRDWIKNHTECQPYQSLAEQAIKDRAAGK